MPKHLILTGKRDPNARQIKPLAKRFEVPFAGSITGVRIGDPEAKLSPLLSAPVSSLINAQTPEASKKKYLKRASFDFCNYKVCSLDAA